MANERCRSPLTRYFDERSDDEVGLLAPPEDPTPGAGASAAHTADGAAENEKKQGKARGNRRAGKRHKNNSKKEQAKFKNTDMADRLRDTEAGRSSRTAMGTRKKGQISRYHDANSMCVSNMAMMRWITSEVEHVDWSRVNWNILTLLGWAWKVDKDAVLKEALCVWDKPDPSLPTKPWWPQVDKVVLAIGNGADGEGGAHGDANGRRATQALRSVGVTVTPQYDQKAEGIWKFCKEYLETASRSENRTPCIYLSGLGDTGFITGTDGQAVKAQDIIDLASESLGEDKVFVLILDVTKPEGSSTPAIFQPDGKKTTAVGRSRRRGLHLLMEREDPSLKDEVAPHRRGTTVDGLPGEGLRAFTRDVLRLMETPTATLQDVQHIRFGLSNTNADKLLQESFLIAPPPQASS